MKLFIISSSILFSVLISSCGGTTTGNPVVEIELGSYDPNSAKPTISQSVSSLSVSSLTLCFKRLRFKTESEETSSDTSTDEDNIDLALGEVTLSSTGSHLANVSIPQGTYSRIEIDLEKDCIEGSSGYSLQIENGLSLKTQDRITIKFEGVFIADNESEKITLGIQTIISALATATSDADLKVKAEGASGSM